jgi:hypothetical protein
VRATVAFAAGESFRKIEGYSPDRPLAEATAGSAGRIHYDAASGLFSMRVAPGPDGTASIAIRRVPRLDRRPPIQRGPAQADPAGALQPPEGLI